MSSTLAEEGDKTKMKTMPIKEFQVLDLPVEFGQPSFDSYQEACDFVSSAEVPRFEVKVLNTRTRFTVRPWENCKK